MNFSTIAAAVKTTTAAVALAVGLAGPAHAETITLGTYGHWQSYAAFQGNRAMCAVATRWSDAALYLKLTTEGVLFLQVVKSGWHIPAGQPIAVQLQIDNAPPLTLRGQGDSAENRNLMPHPHDNDFIVVMHSDTPSPISDKSLIDDLISLMTNGVSMHLYFPNGSEPPWSASLAGSNAALASMTRCAVTLARAAPKQTEPFTPEHEPTVQRTEPF